MAKKSQNRQVSTTQDEKTSILLVSPDDQDRSSLKSILSNGDWQIVQSNTVRQATTALNTVKPALVVCERELEDGGWREVLDLCLQRAEHPAVLVTSRLADESLWAEVLNVGGFDVLLKPFEENEVTRVVGMASRYTPQHRFASSQIA